MHLLYLENFTMIIFVMRQSFVMDFSSDSFCTFHSFGSYFFSKVYHYCISYIIYLIIRYSWLIIPFQSLLYSFSLHSSFNVFDPSFIVSTTSSLRSRASFPFIFPFIISMSHPFVPTFFFPSVQFFISL